MCACVLYIVRFVKSSRNCEHHQMHPIVECSAKSDKNFKSLRINCYARQNYRFSVKIETEIAPLLVRFLPLDFLCAVFFLVRSLRFANIPRFKSSDNFGIRIHVGWHCVENYSFFFSDCVYLLIQMHTIKNYLPKQRYEFRCEIG